MLGCCERRRRLEPVENAASRSNELLVSVDNVHVVLQRILIERACPLDSLRQMRRVRDVAAFSELNYLPLPLLFFDHGECCVGEVQIALDTSLEPPRPANHVDEAALIAIYVGYAKAVDKTVLEGCECYAESCVESRI